MLATFVQYKRSPLSTSSTRATLSKSPSRTSTLACGNKQHNHYSAKMHKLHIYATAYAFAQCVPFFLYAVGFAYGGYLITIDLMVPLDVYRYDENSLEEQPQTTQSVFRDCFLRRRVRSSVVIHSRHRQSAYFGGAFVPHDRNAFLHRSTRRQRSQTRTSVVN